MFLYDLNQKSDLFDFGIEIPVYNDRVIKTIEFLKSHPLLGKKFDQYSIDCVNEVISIGDLQRVHSKEYVMKLFSENAENEIIKAFELIDENGNYNRYNPMKAKLSLADLLNNELKRAAGTLQVSKMALETGFGFYFGGGSHHAQRDYGIGFCVVNDIVIAIRHLQATGLIKSAWVIDIDAHKGDGTAAITYGDLSIKTLSIHMSEGWPLNTERYIDGKPNLSYVPSDIDIPIAPGEDDVYNTRLSAGLKQLLDFEKPELAIVVAGADPYEKDRLASTEGMILTLEQMEERNLLVYEFLKKNNIPQAYLMAGGYCPECWIIYAKFLEKVLLDI